MNASLHVALPVECMELQLLTERRAALISALYDSDGLREQHGAVPGEGRGLGKALHQGAVGMEWAAQGSGHSQGSRSVLSVLSDTEFECGSSCVEPGVGVVEPYRSL